MMERMALRQLDAWKSSENRKPLLLSGARQVGKTHLVRDFASRRYDSYVELNFFTNERLSAIFDADISPAYIIEQLSVLFDTAIRPGKTLIFFDEIQESQRALDALKSFNELAPEYHIIAAGSFLGVVTARFPVGQTDHLRLYPMTFYEFLLATGEDRFAGLIANRRTAMLSEPVREALTRSLRKYFFVGGMPEAVDTYRKTKDFAEVRTVQEKLLQEYRSDFSKHIDKKDAVRVRMLWDSIPVHLFKENKKFVYRHVKTGGRAAEFETAMQWLTDTGLVYRIHKIEHPAIPLPMHMLEEHFKLYALDIGLFSAMAGIGSADLLLAGTDIASAMSGALAEQFVLQEMKASGISRLFYWGRGGSAKAEVDFLIQINGYGIVPVEVKSATNTRAKSLHEYRTRYKPSVSVRASLNDYRVSGDLIDMPLFMVSVLTDLLPAEKAVR